MISLEKIYNINKQIRFKTSMLQSDLRDYSNACIVVKGTITVQTENNTAIDGYNRNLIFKKSAPFTNYISKINNVLIDNAEDLDIVMLMYNLSIAKIIQKHLVLYGIITKVFQLIP